MHNEIFENREVEIEIEIHENSRPRVNIASECFSEYHVVAAVSNIREDEGCSTIQTFRDSYVLFIFRSEERTLQV